MSFVLDSSAVLAVIREEAGMEVVAAAIPQSRVSSVNAVEIVTKLIDLGRSPDLAEAILFGLALDIEPFLPADGVLAGRLRKESKRFGLSLGDRACIATAIRLGATVLTADRIWADLDVGCPIEVIR